MPFENIWIRKTSKQDWERDPLNPTIREQYDDNLTQYKKLLNTKKNDYYNAKILDQEKKCNADNSDAKTFWKCLKSMDDTKKGEDVIFPCAFLTTKMISMVQYKWRIKLSDQFSGVIFCQQKTDLEQPTLPWGLGLKTFCFSSDNVFWNSCIIGVCMPNQTGTAHKLKRNTMQTLLRGKQQGF